MENETPNQRAFRAGSNMTQKDAHKAVREMKRKLAIALRKQKMNRIVK